MDGVSQANGGEAETKGVEIDFDVMLADGLYMDFAGSFMTAETTIDMPSFGASAGDSLPGTVEEQYNVGLSYDYAMGSKICLYKTRLFILWRKLCYFWSI